MQIHTQIPSFNSGISRTWAFYSILILLFYSLSTILIVAIIGGPPENAAETFEMIRQNRFQALLRMDLLTIFVMPCYYILFYAIYLELKSINGFGAFMLTVFIFAGVTIFLAAPSLFSYVQLADLYATGDAEIRQQSLGGMTGLLAADIWHGTGPRLGGLLVQAGATGLSVLMLKSNAFSKKTAYVGIATHGLDLLHVLIGFFSLSASNAVMAVAGVMYLAWFPLIAIDFAKLKKMVIS